MAAAFADHGIVFPTGVGMNRWRRPAWTLAVSVPHRRGDEPIDRWDTLAGDLCSPQAWG